ncbi:VTT domain-containing protein [Neobacillus sp. WH10]|uniref:VTT domain-containing protein n=1 Tax=Neobacillus sp. WH10 TaxID=3047873 RepID=UPI0024C11387|nr:VTT domain-containing protein [Neobacillus sp. WH10]WHY76864.1 VTT domain-containing protein [Neobacillus sp. WH10]
MSNYTAYIDQYGYIVLFAALFLELIAFPLPGEVLMSYSGFLVFQGHLNWLVSILMAGAGACTGMTLSYWIGFKLGKPFFVKYGHRFHLGPERIEKTSQWYSKHGNKLLIIAYFIPGVRHITGYFSGITRLPFRKFALFAYSGAFIWVTTFITLGKILGPQWEQFHSSIKTYLIIGGIIAAILMIAVFIIRKYKLELKDAAVRALNITLNIFHSRRRVGLLLGITAALTLGLIILMIGMIQDFLAGEFSDFNEIVNLLVSLTFSKDWTETMRIFLLMGSRQVHLLLITLTVFWILWKGRDKRIEFLSLCLVAGGGEIYEESLRKIFHKLSPVNQSMMDNLFHSFPSEQLLMTIVIYGFAVFLFVRHSRKVWVHTVIPIAVLVLLILIAISRLYFNIELPSDVAAGCVFGGVWLGLNILLLEIYRILRNMDSTPIKQVG